MVKQAAGAASMPKPATPVMLVTAMVTAAMFVAKIAVVERSAAVLSAVAAVVPVRIEVAVASAV
jgi:hypothetical protein